MAELADALDSGSSEHYAHASSSLVIRSVKPLRFVMSHNGFFYKILRIYDHNKKVRQALLCKI